MKAIVVLAAMSLLAVTSASAGGNERSVVVVHHPRTIVSSRAHAVVVPYPSAWSIYQSLRRPYLCHLPSEPCDNARRVTN